MIKTLKKMIPERHPIRLFYHKFLAVLAAVIYRFPSKDLAVIGVTGTKGKTTTTNLIAKILTEAGYRVGMTSTINFQVANYGWVNESKMTTLSPFFLQKMLRQMVNARCQFAVIEVSSHSLIQNRVWGINFDTAVLTNIGEDHLDYHGGFREYLRAKGLLFAKINRSDRKPKTAKTIILNHDDENFAYFDQFKAEKRYDFGLKGGTCSASNIKYSQTGVDFTLHVPNNQVDISMKMPGQFSVYNALAGAAVALANGINVSVIKAALEKASTVAGRFEQIDCGQNFAVIVDYAHTEESLKSLLELYKGQTPGKLITVFGATGGGRDKAKRAKMGAAADQFSDFIVLTDDDPYEESRSKIIEDIAKGIKRQEGERFWKIPTRMEAIKFALRTAEKGDTVVIAGKGAETVQAIGDEKIPWDDRKVVREILAQPLTVEL
jgi:UDP-N-acetylmuramoyl-L-alanyl-D-glutamate--2,6-diaminopimelate ligase